MKTLALCFALAIASAGCLGTFIPDPKPASGPADMANGGGSGNGSGNGTGNGNGTGGNGTSTDMANAPAASTDMAGVLPGVKAFGDTCTVAGDCQSTLCEPFVQGTVHRCTKSCTVATQATDCPAPSDGTCTNNGYCKFIQ
ncbi:MAG: hypothetical protein ACXVDD_27995 [Polyangia bacterium]